MLEETDVSTMQDEQDAPQQGLLTQDLSEMLQMNQEPASTGQRFANLLIDMVVFYLLIIVVGILAGVLAAAGYTGLLSFFTELQASGTLIDRLFTALLIVVYFTLIEGLTKGRTIGKLITGTRAVDFTNYEPINFSTAFMRSLCRIVPFELFSGFGTPWHDKWTNSTVIKVRR